MPFSRTFVCRSEGIGCVHIHSNLKESYGRFEVGGRSRTRFIYLDVWSYELLMFGNSELLLFLSVV